MKPGDFTNSQERHARAKVVGEMAMLRQHLQCGVYNPDCAYHSAVVPEGFVVFTDFALYGAIFQPQRFKTSP